MSVVSMKQLLEAGVHFGHQTRRWNPKMAQYIYMERNGIYIIDLQKTVRKLEDAYNFIREVSENGGNVLFVGTKKQAQDAVKEEAERVGMFFVNARWLGGMLTNFKTMRMRIDRLAQLRQMQDDGTFDILPKKEVIRLTGEINRLEKYLGGVKDMKKLPAALFIIDPRKERNAIAEARKLGIPIVAIVDTNCDPDEIDYIIPGNDDAIRAIRLIAQAMANAVIEGRQGLDTMEINVHSDDPAAQESPEEKLIVNKAPATKPFASDATVTPPVVKEAPVAIAQVTKAPAKEAPVEEPVSKEPEAKEAPVEKQLVKDEVVEEPVIEKSIVIETPVDEVAVEENNIEEAKAEEAHIEEVPTAVETPTDAPVKKPARKPVKKADEATADVATDDNQLPSVDADTSEIEKPQEEAPVKKTTRKSTKKTDDAPVENTDVPSDESKPAVEADAPVKKTTRKSTKKVDDVL